MRSLKISKLCPGGNTTIIVFDRLPRKYHPAIARSILHHHPDCEQVGFIEPANDEKAVCRLQMMGGEFCGNATRSIAWLIAEYFLKHAKVPHSIIKDGFFSVKWILSQGNQLDFFVEVSGAHNLLKVQAFFDPVSNHLLDIIVPMPIRSGKDCIEKCREITRDGNTMQASVVHLDGISHVVVSAEDYRKIGGKVGELSEAKRILDDLGLSSLEAAGVLFVTGESDILSINPIVYVRETNTLIPETACGSGTIALVQKVALDRGSGITLSIKQPSGRVIIGSVNFDGERFSNATIRGVVTIVGEEIFELPDAENPLRKVEIRQIKNQEELAPYAAQVGALYARIFADAPYYEQFTSEEGHRYLRETAEANYGLLFLAFDGDEVVGFGGGLPLTYYPDICEVIKGHLNPERTFYMAELGVDYCYRNEGISHQLIDVRLKDIIPEQFDNVLVRTSVANNLTQHLYCDRRGFTIIPKVRQQVVNRKFLPGVAKPQDVPDERLFLISSINSAKQNVVI